MQFRLVTHMAWKDDLNKSFSSPLKSIADTGNQHTKNERCQMKHLLQPITMVQLKVKGIQCSNL